MDLHAGSKRNLTLVMDLYEREYPIPSIFASML